MARSPRIAARGNTVSASAAVLPGLRSAWLRCERALDVCFSEAANPCNHLGAIACLLLAVLLLSGIYLYAVFDTSVEGAYASINALSLQPPLSGGWLRSMHRYAADAFVVVCLLHLLRELLVGHYTRFRRVTWLTGVPLLGLMYVSGIGGYWLAWDQLSQYAAVASAELIDGLPLLHSTLTRNFIAPDAVSDRLFSLLIFVHLGVPLLLLFGLWFHLQRVSRPRVWPPRTIALGILIPLALVALALPVQSQSPAQLSSSPTALAYDWIVLHPLALAELVSADTFWACVALLTAVLFGLAAWPTVAQPVAVVDADNCNGCRRCVDDCPYSALTLEAHPNGKPNMQIVVVAAERCASCGICAGACPSATPFRRTQALINGIDMPNDTIDQLRTRLHEALAQRAGAPVSVIFGCQQGADVDSVTGPDVIGFSLLCAGALPLSFIEYALREGAALVIVSGCVGSTCTYRLGSDWTQQRLSGERPPRLRASVPNQRLRWVAANRGQEERVRLAVNAGAAAAEGHSGE